MKITAQNVIKKWSNFVNQSDLPNLMGLYATDATLVPTFSHQILQTRQEIEDYFVGLSKNETEVQISEESFRIHQYELGCLINGEYIFSMNLDGKRVYHPARFSFLLNLSREDAILLQHSSVLPIMVVGN